MKEVSPQITSDPNNLTFRCCKSTIFILQTCFISLIVFFVLFLVCGGHFPLTPCPLVQNLFWVWTGQR